MEAILLILICKLGHIVAQWWFRESISISVIVRKAKIRRCTLNILFKMLLEFDQPAIRVIVFVNIILCSYLHSFVIC